MAHQEIQAGEYSYLPIERVHFGQGAITKLAGELQRLESKRPFLVTGRSIAQQTDLVSRIEKASEMKLAGIFSGIKQHAPSVGVTAATDEARKFGADCLISLGGGSPIDSTKIVVKDLSKNFQEPHLPHIAIPTTLSAAEFSHVAGMTDERINRKTGFRDVRLVPRIIFLDPQLTIQTPSWLWASTGIRSLDHAVEAVYSPRHQPFVDTLALEAIRLIFQNLATSTNSPRNMPIRLLCQLAAWMSFAGVLNVGTGLSHAIGRVIGATWNIPHGITSCLTLAEVMRAEAERYPGRLSLIAAAEGQNLDRVPAKKAALSAAEGVKKLINGLGLSKQLRDYGINREDLPRIASEAAAPEQRQEALDILEKII